jgi:hypothetical protein
MDFNLTRFEQMHIKKVLGKEYKHVSEIEVNEFELILENHKIGSVHDLTISDKFLFYYKVPVYVTVDQFNKTYFKVVKNKQDKEKREKNENNKK